MRKTEHFIHYHVLKFLGADMNLIEGIPDYNDASGGLKGEYDA